MKKIMFILLMCFSLMIGAKADSGGRELIFVYNDNSFSSAVKTYISDRTLLTVSYRNAVTDLSTSQLAEILNQTSNTNAGKLYVYGNVSVKLTPAVDGKYEVLKDSTTIYYGISDPVWEDSNAASVTKSTVASAKTKETNLYIPVMNVYYRETTADEWTKTTNFVASESRSLESQLAELLNIDLETTPNAVVEAYNDLYKFEALDDTFTATVRVDIYDKNADKEPTLVTDSTTEYTAESLKHLGSEYLVMKFTAPAGQTAVYVNDTKAAGGNVLTKIILVTVLLGILGGGTYYLKKNNLISFE